MRQNNIQHTNGGLPPTHVQDVSSDSADLETKVSAARLAMERAVGFRLEIDRFERIQIEGTWKLRVFWRKASN